MKKQFIYAGMFLFTIGFSACNEDFKDWAAPQSNPQEDSAEQMTATFKMPILAWMKPLPTR